MIDLEEIIKKVRTYPLGLQPQFNALDWGFGELD